MSVMGRHLLQAALCIELAYGAGALKALKVGRVHVKRPCVVHAGRQTGRQVGWLGYLLDASGGPEIPV
jgi:hypothetical protein